MTKSAGPLLICIGILIWVIVPLLKVAGFLLMVSGFAWWYFNRKKPSGKA